MNKNFKGRGAMMNIARIKFIIVDLDGTLLHTDKTLSAYTVKCFNECKKRGIKIIVATARPFRTAVQYSDLINADAMVVSNGARIVFRNQKTDYGICQQSAEQILTILSRYPNLRITLETGEVAYSNRLIKDYETIISNNLVDISNAEGALKILVHLDNKETFELIQKELTDDLYITISQGYLLQIMNIFATKWNGIKSLLDIFNCSPNETIYFGDDQDDIEPIKKCGFGVAVSNGIDDVKNIADYITDANDADGVAKFIERRILKCL